MAEAFLERVAARKPAGRIHVETVSSPWSPGSPHYFSAMLPARFNIPVVPGFLAESSVTSPFVIPVLASWGQGVLSGREALFSFFDWFNPTMTAECVVKRLALFHVQYVLTASAGAAEHLRNAPPEMLSEVEHVGGLSLFELKEFAPLLQTAAYRPYLYVGEDGSEFRRFCEQWYQHDRLLNFPVIYSPRDPLKLPEREKAQMGGFVANGKARAAPEVLEAFQSSDRPVILLGRKPRGIKIGAAVQRAKDLPSLAALLERHTDGRSPGLAVAPVNMSGHEISFDGQSATIINYSYFPRWTSEAENQTVFMTCPGFMFVFGNGKNHLVYR